MKYLILKTSTLFNSVIIIISTLISAFFLLFGIANLINPDVRDGTSLTLNTVVCLVVCLIGLSFLLLAIAAFRGILYKNKNKI